MWQSKSCICRCKLWRQVSRPSNPGYLIGRHIDCAVNDQVMLPRRKWSKVTYVLKDTLRLRACQQGLSLAQNS